MDQISQLLKGLDEAPHFKIDEKVRKSIADARKAAKAKHEQVLQKIHSDHEADMKAQAEKNTKEIQDIDDKAA